MQSKLIRWLANCTAIVFILVCAQTIRDWLYSASRSAPDRDFNGVMIWALVLLVALTLFTIAVSVSKLRLSIAVKSSVVAAFVTFGSTALALLIARGKGADPLSIACACSVVAAYSALAITLFYGALRLIAERQLRPIVLHAA